MSDNIRNTEFDLHQFIATVRRRWMLISIVIVAFVLLTGITSFTRKPLYRATAVISLPTLEWSILDVSKPPILLLPIQSYDVENFISSFELYSRNGDVQAISKGLDISTDQASAVVALKVKLIREGKNQLEITLELRDPSLAKLIFEHLVLALNNQNTYKEKLSEETANLLERRKEIQNYLRDNEQLYQIAQNEIHRGSVSSLHFNPTEIGEVIVRYRQELKNINKDIKSVASFKLEQESIPVSIGPSMLKRLVLAAVLGCFAGLFAAVYQEWRERAAGS